MEEEGFEDETEIIDAKDGKAYKMTVLEIN
jgi:hypothetical protein